MTFPSVVYTSSKDTYYKQMITIYLYKYESFILKELCVLNSEIKGIFLNFSMCDFEL